jgi:hypothetical protein
MPPKKHVKPQTKEELEAALVNRWARKIRDICKDDDSKVTCALGNDYEVTCPSVLYEYPGYVITSNQLRNKTLRQSEHLQNQFQQQGGYLSVNDTVTLAGEITKGILSALEHGTTFTPVSVTFPSSPDGTISIFVNQSTEIRDIEHLKALLANRLIRAIATICGNEGSNVKFEGFGQDYPDNWPSKFSPGVFASAPEGGDGVIGCTLRQLNTKVSNQSALWRKQVIESSPLMRYSFIINL